jgi:hypothetical protein
MVSPSSAADCTGKRYEKLHFRHHALGGTGQLHLKTALETSLHSTKSLEPIALESGITSLILSPIALQTPSEVLLKPFNRTTNCIEKTAVETSLVHVLAINQPV